MRKIVILLLLIHSIFASEVYFMPREGYSAQKRLFNLFTHAKHKIEIVMYTFTNRKLAKALKIAAKKGVKITIIADKKEAKYKYSVIPNLAAIKNFKIYLLSGKKYKDNTHAKMHVKLSIIDGKYLVTGSANYSYSAFFKNYEYIIIDKNRKLIKKFESFFQLLKNSATKYRLSR